MLIICRTGIHKMLVRIANGENPDQTASEESYLGLCCLSRPFWQATVVFEILEHLSYVPHLIFIQINLYICILTSSSLFLFNNHKLEKNPLNESLTNL